MRRIFTKILVVLVVSTMVFSTLTVYSQPDEHEGDLEGSGYSRQEFPGEKGGKQCQRSENAENFIEELDLTEEQQAALKEGRRKHEKGKATLSLDLRYKRQDLREELEKADSDKGKIDKLVAEINDLQAQLVRQRVENILRVKSILTPEQYTKFNEKCKKRRMGGKQARRRMKMGHGRKGSEAEEPEDL